jgi:hypothetical protein
MVTTTSVTGHVTHLPHTVPTLSTDATILLVIVAIVAYAVFAGFVPLTRFAAGIYIGLVLVASFGSAAYNLTQHGSAGGSSTVNRSMVQLALFILPLAVVQIGHPLRSHVHKVGMVWLLILGAMTSLLAVAAGLSVLDNTTLQFTLNQSNLASQIYSLRLPLIAAVPVAMAVAAVLHRKHHGH